MKKSVNLQGIWEFSLDQDKQGVKEGYFAKDFHDTITLPGTTSMAKKGTCSDKK